MDSVLLTLAGGAAIAGFVQGLSGFAFGLVAMSLWAWTLEPRLAAVMTVFGSVVGQLVAALSVRRGRRWPVLAPFLVGAVIGVPLGVWTLKRVDPTWFKAMLGLLLVSWAPTMLWSTRMPRLTGLGARADGTVGLIGGVLGGLGGFSGALPSLWVMFRGFDRDLARSVIQTFNLVTLSITFAAYLASGVVTPDMWPMFAVVAPALLVPTLIGTRVYLGIDETLFRRIVLTLLTLSGLALLAASLPVLLRR